MSIFGKKEDQFEEEEILEEGRKITRNLKDLKSENKRKRKEPPKPWGKKERLLVFLVLLATTVASAVLLLRSSVKLKSDNPSITLPKFNLDSINFFKGETIVIEKK
jgi:hypothetical protein